MKKIALGILIALLSFRCGTKDGQVERFDLEVSGDNVYLPDNSPIREMIQLHTISEIDFRHELISTGTVRAIPNHYAEIAAPFSGRILKSFVELGQKVQAGSPVFQISSPDYFDAQKDYFDAQQEFKQAELDLKRQQDLVKHGVGIQRELEESETGFSIKQTALANASSALGIFNIDPAKTVLGQPLTVTSPIKGEVINSNIVIGEYLREDAAPIATVAALDKVWVAGRIREKDFAFIHNLDEAEIIVPSSSGRIIKGSIYHINEIIDKETRSLQVLAECDNQSRDLKPGMFVTVKFIDNSARGIVVPPTSVLQMENHQFVYVKVGDDQYQKRIIETGGTVNENIIVTSGLEPGEVIVSHGGIYFLN